MAKKKQRKNKKAKTTEQAKPTPQRTPYDQSYKQFFSRHDMVESLKGPASVLLKMEM